MIKITICIRGLFLLAIMQVAKPLIDFRLHNCYKIDRSLKASTQLQLEGSVGRKNIEWEIEVRKGINEKDWAFVASKLRELSSSILPNGHNAIFTVTETCRRSNNLGAVVPLLMEIPSEAIRLVEDDIMPLLSECARSGNMQPAEKLLSWVEERQPQALTAKSYSVMMKGYGRQQNLRMLQKTLSSVMDKKVPADLVFVNSAMDGYIRCQKPLYAVRLFMYLPKSSGLNVVDRALSKHVERNIENVYNYFDFRSKGDLLANMRSFNTLLKALRDLGEDGYEATVEIIDAMKSCALDVDVISLNTMVDICVKNGGIQLAEELFLSSKINLGVEAYTSLIAGYAEIGDLTKAFRTFEAMAANGIRPNVFTNTALMNACFRADDIVSARDLLQKAVKESSSNKENLRALYGAYVIGLSKLGADMNNDTKTAFYDMIKLNLFPDTATMNAVIQNICGKGSKNVLQALEMTRVMMGKGFKPDDFTYSILFTALGRAGEIKEVARLFEAANVTFDATTINSMLGAYASSEDPLTSVRIFEKLINRDTKNGAIEYFIPTQITYTILFSAIAQSAMLYSMPSEDNISKIPLKEYDKITRKIFKSMRFDYDINIDNIMLSVLNRLAGLYLFDRDNTLFSSQRIQGILSKETARFIFEDLLIVGCNAHEIGPILDACDYPSWKKEQILQRPAGVNKSDRGNVASYKIFKKYGWNRVDSGWSSFFNY